MFQVTADRSLEKVAQIHRMPKKIFTTTDETRTVLSGHEAAIAKAKGVCASYLYNIKNGDASDPYPPFREWFQFCAIGGGNVRAYLHDLEAILLQAEHGNKNLNLSDILTRKIDADAESSHVLVEAIGEGKLNGRECDQILNACDKVEGVTREIRETALTVKNELNIRDFAKGAVSIFRAKA